jgi:hypothetical protein
MGALFLSKTMQYTKFEASMPAFRELLIWKCENIEGIASL